MKRYENYYGTHREDRSGGWVRYEDAIAAVAQERERRVSVQAITALAERYRDSLRAQQARDVMPLIGPLLDAWEACSQRCREQLPELDKQLRRINQAMEDADMSDTQETKAPEPGKEN